MKAARFVDPDERREIIGRFARLSSSGAPVCCTPTQAELSGQAPRVMPWGNDGKVIFDDRQSAEACARALEAIGCGPQVAYECRRGTRGHHHLTTRGASAARERTRRGAGKGRRRGVRW